MELEGLYMFLWGVKRLLWLKMVYTCWISTVDVTNFSIGSPLRDIISSWQCLQLLGLQTN